MNYAFVDSQNLHLGTTRSRPSWKIDLVKFRIFLEKRYKVEKAYYFLGVFDGKYQKMYDFIQDSGYILVFREHAGSQISKKKGNVDTDIIFYMLTKLLDRERFDGIILVSGDGDYWRTVDYLIGKKRFVKLLAPSQHAISSLYKRIPDSYRVFLDDKDTKKKIEYKSKVNKKAGSP
jgi:uncharacterized LabA/DUF88 family protein